MKTLKELLNKWHIFIKILPFLITIFILKLAFHKFSLEIITLNALFTSMIAATTFLIGFLITGVISDYKESEKIPGELATSLEVIYDEAYSIHKTKNTKQTKELLDFHKTLMQSINKWFYKEESTQEILTKISNLNDLLITLDGIAPASSISRLKQEQNNIRKFITRVNVISETSFIQSAYAIVEALATFVIIGLLVIKLDPFYESVFFSLVVSFLVLYMVFLIRDLDDPFEYNKYGEAGSEISLKPIQDLNDRLYPISKQKKANTQNIKKIK
ncbi:MAG: hypothetical protein WC758_01995 [Candidatus Woesearchaeota archaeon]|jgi:hypothetical protein